MTLTSTVKSLRDSDGVLVHKVTVTTESGGRYICSYKQSQFTAGEAANHLVDAVRKAKR